MQITSLAPRTWQAAVVQQLVHKHSIDPDDARQHCWLLRFPLTELHADGGTAQRAAAWVASCLEDGPRVLNKRHDSRVPATYIGRGSAWGNPFVLGRDGDRQVVVLKHERWLRTQHHLLRKLPELRGKHLMCFCAPLACHGDLLLKLSNGTREQLIAWWRCEAA